MRFQHVALKPQIDGALFELAYKMKENTMRKNIVTKTSDWEMRKEYDLSNSRPNKYAKKYAAGTNIVVIEPDLVEFFPNTESVNNALRALASIFPRSNVRKKPKKSLVALHQSTA